MQRDTDAEMCSADRTVLSGSPSLTTMRAGRRERHLAFAVIVLSTLVFAAVAPFARVPLAKMPAFIPVYESALMINDLITSLLLFGQFAQQRSRAILVLACGYLFDGLLIVPHALTFPGLFTPTGLLGAGSQSTAWLYMFWHGGLPITVISYALLKGRSDDAGAPTESVRRTLLACAGAVVSAAAALTLLATTGEALLPNLMAGHKSAAEELVVILIIWTLTLVALLILWRRPAHTVLDVWLMVVMCAWLFDVALSAILNTGRFDLGFYAGRAYGLLASTFVLVILLLETGTLYAQLARLFEVEHAALRQEAEERRRIFETS